MLTYMVQQGVPRIVTAAVGSDITMLYTCTVGKGASGVSGREQKPTTYPTVASVGTEAAASGGKHTTTYRLDL